MTDADPARPSQDALYAEAAAAHGAALERLARAYEAEPERRRDLVQDIHLELWKSLKVYDGRCSLRTWTFRVAHNTGAGHVARDRRRVKAFADLETLDIASPDDSPETVAGEAQALERLMALIHGLKPIDRQVMLLWLEELDAQAIAEVSGLSPGAVAVKIHRIKALLASKFRPEAAHAG